MGKQNILKGSLNELSFNAEIVVVSNLDAHIELEFNMYETYKDTDLEKMRSLQR